MKSCVERSRWLRRFDLAKIQKQRGVAIELRENIRRLLRVDSYKLLPARMEKLRKAETVVKRQLSTARNTPQATLSGPSFFFPKRIRYSWRMLREHQQIPIPICLAATANYPKTWTFNSMSGSPAAASTSPRRSCRCRRACRCLALRPHRAGLGLCFDLSVCTPAYLRDFECSRARHSLRPLWATRSPLERPRR